MNPLAIGFEIQGINRAMDQLNRFANAIGEFNNAQIALNSGAADTRSVQMLGAVAGTNAVAAAGSLRQQANFDPLGRLAAGRLGMEYNPYDLNSAQDEGKQLIDALKALREEFKRSPAEERLTLRQLPALQPFAAIIEAQKDLIPLMERQAELQKAVFNPANMSAMQEMKTNAEGFASFVEAAGAAFAAEQARRLSATSDFMTQHFGSADVGFFNPGARSAGAQGTARDEHTKAIKENTDALQQLNGIWGGGPRSQGAIPRAFFGGMSANDTGGWQYLKGEAARLGAYSIGL